MTFSLHSPAFKDGAAIPETYAKDGLNRSPPLRWTDPPAETRSFMLVVEDPDAPAGVFRHWALHGLPKDQRELREGAGGDTVAMPARNDFGGLGYDGPAPPRGDGAHRYSFRLAALDVPRLDVPEGASARAVVDSARRHILDEAEITGLYAR
jgi:Raf kinase inhibitor-like YbhB/YbcL family protein